MDIHVSLSIWFPLLKSRSTQLWSKSSNVHDTCLLVDKRPNSRKEVGYLDGTARKRQSKRCSSQLHKTRIRLYSWQLYRSWSIQRISTQYWMVRRRSESLRCIGFQWRHLPRQQGGQRPEFRAAIQERQSFTAADTLAPPIFPKPNWQQQQQSQQQHGSRVRSQETSDSSRAGRDPMRKGTLAPRRSDDKWNNWSAWNQDLIQSLFKQWRVGHQRCRFFCDRQGVQTVHRPQRHITKDCALQHTRLRTHSFSCVAQAVELHLCAIKRTSSVITATCIHRWHAHIHALHRRHSRHRDRRAGQRIRLQWATLAQEACLAVLPNKPLLQVVRQWVSEAYSNYRHRHSGRSDVRTGNAGHARRHVVATLDHAREQARG